MTMINNKVAWKLIFATANLLI